MRLRPRYRDPICIYLLPTQPPILVIRATENLIKIPDDDKRTKIRKKSRVRALLVFLPFHFFPAPDET